METTMKRPPGNEEVDEELIDTLIAISVVAKRLAEKLRKENASRCTGCAYAEGRKTWRNT